MIKINHALSLLADDHKKIGSMFSQFRALTKDQRQEKIKLIAAIFRAVAVHAQMEEEILYPAITSEISDKRFADEVLGKLTATKLLITNLEHMHPNDPLYDEKVRMLETIFFGHVETEEGQLFSQIRESKIDLIAIGEDLAIFRDE
ncbi:hemerythrin domain-containing protein [Glaciimonas sp. GNP009]